MIDCLEFAVRGTLHRNGERMAIPKRGARNIVVDGQPYRWYVRRKPSYGQAICESPMCVAVEYAQARSSVLVASLPQFHTGNWMGGVTGPVVPADVERCIRAALADGWKPTEAGKTFVLESLGTAKGEAGL